MTKDDFAKLYDVKHIWNYTLDEQRCHTGQAPTIRACIKDYGIACVREVVRQHLDLFIEFISASQKPNNRQRDIIAWFVLTQYQGMKITEFQLFIIKMMSGYFGKFYKTLDSMDITANLKEWYKECERIRNEYRFQQLRAEREKERETEHMSDEDRAKAIELLDRVSRRLRINGKGGC